MAIAGSYWSYSGNVYLDLARNGTFTIEGGGRRYWGRWKEAGWFSSGVTFHIDDYEFECSLERGVDKSIGSQFIVLRSQSGSPVDGKWYIRKGQ